jgi:hypothetical protein
MARPHTDGHRFRGSSASRRDRFHEGNLTGAQSRSFSPGNDAGPASLNQGRHFITAVFGGNAFNFGSTSSQLEFDVAKAATSVAVSAPASVIYGNPVTVTAMVSSSTAAVTESEVWFTNGGQLLGSAPVINGQAHISLNLFSTTTITATYVEGNDFDDSAGSNVSVAIAKAATSISWSAGDVIPTGRTLVEGNGQCQRLAMSIQRAVQEGTSFAPQRCRMARRFSTANRWRRGSHRRRELSR